MSIYAIGDVQGCFAALERLLVQINYNPNVDQLWFAGDLVNRGENSLGCLRFIKHQVEQHNAKVVLGNHDLHLLAVYAGFGKLRKKDTLDDILQAPDVHELMHWLRQQPLFHWQPESNWAMVHAGVPPTWSPATTQRLAQEVQTVLSGSHWQDFIANMYGDLPDLWQEDLTGHARLRIIVNYLTRMRMLDQQARLNLEFKGAPELAPANLVPWFVFLNEAWDNTHLLFGHWAALQGQCCNAQYFALDTGCVWGNQLSALRLQDKRWFAVEA